LRLIDFTKSTTTKLSIVQQHNITDEPESEVTLVKWRVSRIDK